MSLLFRKPLSGLALTIALLVLPACQATHKLVLIQYDQGLNFMQYEFKNPIMADSSLGMVEWDSMDFWNLSSPPGVFVVYLLCSIENDFSQAQTFNFDAAKLYVLYKGQKHYYRPLVPYSVENQAGQLLEGPPGSPEDTKLTKAFQQETQLGNPTSSVPPIPTDLPYRFVIYVTGAIGDSDLLNEKMPLFYDGAPVDMINRNNPPIPNQSAAASSLPFLCRPKVQ
jgi:hypothetical protein